MSAWPKQYFARRVDHPLVPEAHALPRDVLLGSALPVGVQDDPVAQVDLTFLTPGPRPSASHHRHGADVETLAPLVE